MKISVFRRSGQVSRFSKRSRSFSELFSDFWKQLHLHALIIFLGFCLCCGIVGGAVFFTNAENADALKIAELCLSGIFGRSEADFFSVFISSAALNFAFLLLCFLFGLSFWGVFLIPLIPAIRGISFGVISAYLYAAHGLTGLLYQFFVVLPGTYPAILSILRAAKEGFVFSGFLLSKFRVTDSSSSVSGSFTAYFTRFSRCLFWGVGAAFLDALTAITISRIFSF